MGPDRYENFKMYLRMSGQSHLAGIICETERELTNGQRTNRPSQDPEFTNTLQGKILVIFLLCRECLRYSKCVCCVCFCPY